VPDEVGRVNLFAEEDSIIISRMNTSDLVAKSAYVAKTFDTLFLPDRLWMTEKSKLPHNIKWLSFAIGQESFRVEVSKSASGTSGSMKNISQSNFLKTPIIYPPVDAQIEFAQKLYSIEHLRDLLIKSIGDAEELFNALLQQSFKGELN
jgi:type I restriction enzyme S subunit